MPQEYFSGLAEVNFVGSESRESFAYRFYNADQIVAGKTMREHFRFAVAYWHSFGGQGADPFGQDTRLFPWNRNSDPKKRACDKMDAAFEFMQKLGIDFYCFHDFDLIDEGASLSESRERLDFISDYALQKQKVHSKKVLWATANLFSHPRYMNGAATNPNFDVLSMAAAQVQNALDIAIKLGAENYVFWGGREGYQSLLNTDTGLELKHLGEFLRLCRDYARSQGFKGNFFIEPKPMEPSKHQYDFDAATVIGFLREQNLDGDFKLNIEANHATLALHSFTHELQMAANAGMLGSIDANRGDYQNGWDTDQFPNNIYELTEAMLIILQSGGLSGGGVNFDAKIRRNSTDILDLAHAHIGAIDLFARALIIADQILNDSDYLKWFQARYASFKHPLAKSFEAGEASLQDLTAHARQVGEIPLESGRQEEFENLLNRYI
jgi:xylose isomerase